MSEPNKLSVESGSDESEYTFGRQPIQDWPQHQKKRYRTASPTHPEAWSETRFIWHKVNHGVGRVKGTLLRFPQVSMKCWRRWPLFLIGWACFVILRFPTLRFQMYLQMYEMLMLEAFILYWMSMFRDQPKPNNQESLAFERAPVLY